MYKHYLNYQNIFPHNFNNDVDYFFTALENLLLKPEIIFQKLQ